MNALITVSVFVGNELLNQKAIVLPRVSKLFTEKYGSDGDMYNMYIEINDTTIKYTSKWLLEQLILLLGVHMDYKCIHKKFGVILYRHNGDLLCSLSWALGSINEAENPPTNTLAVISNDEQILSTAACIINNHLLQDIKGSIAIKQNTEENPEGLKIDEIMKNMSPMLIEFIEKCTKSSREKTHTRLSDHLKHIKKLRRFFILCCYNLHAIQNSHFENVSAWLPPTHVGVCLFRPQ